MADTNIQSYTGSIGAAEKKITDLTSAVKSGYSGLPGITEALRKSLYEREKTLPGLERDVESKITELYTADKRLAERYATPGGEMYIEDPMARQALISGQKADIRGEYGNMLNLIQSRQNVIGSALDKGLELYKAGLAAQEFELNQAEKEWDRAWKVQESKKGTGTAAAKSAGMAEFLRALITRTQGWTPTEKQPTATPTDTNVEWHSPQGQWQWNAEQKQWLPSGQEGTPRADQELTDILTKYPIIAEDVLGSWSKIYPKAEELTQTEQYNQDLQRAVNAIKSGQKKSDLIYTLSTKYPSKNVTVTTDLEVALTQQGVTAK